MEEFPACLQMLPSTNVEVQDPRISVRWLKDIRQSKMPLGDFKIFRVAEVEHRKLKSFPEHEFLVVKVACSKPIYPDFFVRFDRDAEPNAPIETVPLKARGNKLASLKASIGVTSPFNYTNSRDRVTIFKDKDSALKWSGDGQASEVSDDATESHAPQWVCRVLSFTDRDTAPTIVELASAAAVLSEIGNKYNSVSTMCYWYAFWIYDLLRETTMQLSNAAATVEDSVKEGRHGTCKKVRVLNSGLFVLASSLGMTSVVRSIPQNEMFPPKDSEGVGQRKGPEIISKDAILVREDQV